MTKNSDFETRPYNVHEIDIASEEVQAFSKCKLRMHTWAFLNESLGHSAYAEQLFKLADKSIKEKFQRFCISMGWLEPPVLRAWKIDRDEYVIAMASSSVLMFFEYGIINEERSVLRTMTIKQIPQTSDLLTLKFDTLEMHRNFHLRVSFGKDELASRVWRLNREGKETCLMAENHENHIVLNYRDGDLVIPGNEMRFGKNYTTYNLGLEDARIIHHLHPENGTIALYAKALPDGYQHVTVTDNMIDVKTSTGGIVFHYNDNKELSEIVGSDSTVEFEEMIVEEAGMYRKKIFRSIDGEPPICVMDVFHEYVLPRE